MKYKLSKNIFNFNKNIFFIIFFIIILLILYLYYKKYYIYEHYSNGILDLLQYKGTPTKYNIEENKDGEN